MATEKKQGSGSGDGMEPDGSFLIRQLDLSDPVAVTNVLALQKASYAIEAAIIGFENIPPLHDTMESLQAYAELFFGCYLGDELAGILSFTVEAETLDICRVAVRPRFFRRGIAAQLLRFAETRPGIRRLVVSTGRDNQPAVNLYLKLGFTRVRDAEVAKGLYVAEFQKDL